MIKLPNEAQLVIRVVDAITPSYSGAGGYPKPAALMEVPKRHVIEQIVYATLKELGIGVAPNGSLVAPPAVPLSAAELQFAGDTGMAGLRSDSEIRAAFNWRNHPASAFAFAPIDGPRSQVDEKPIGPARAAQLDADINAKLREGRAIRSARKVLVDLATNYSSAIHNAVSAAKAAGMTHDEAREAIGEGLGRSPDTGPAADFALVRQTGDGERTRGGRSADTWEPPGGLKRPPASKRRKRK